MEKIRLSISIALCFALCVLCPHILRASGIEDVQILEASPDGLVIRYQTPELEIDTKTVDGQTYQALSFKNCGFTQEIGRPQIPIKIVCLGIPDVSEPGISVLGIGPSLQSGYRVYPVENQVVYRDAGTVPTDNESGLSSSANIHYTAGTEFVIDRSFYRTNRFYPADLAKIESMGYIRQQRIARLELHPVQYNPSTGQLKIHKTLEVRVKFGNLTNMAPSRILNAGNSGTSAQGAFEDLYRDMILNYEQAKNWRKSRRRSPSSFAMAPDISAATSPNPGDQRTWYKLFIKRNSMYKLDYSYFVKAGIDPAEIDPQKIEILSNGERVPIYVEGYDDGSFDPDDFIEFYGVAIDSFRTDENVYWLSWGGLGTSGAKSWLMPVKDGTPKASDLTPPVAFWDTEHWESDVLHDPLKDVTADASDHMFWTQMRGDDPVGSVKSNILLALPYRAANISKSFKLRVCFQGVTYARGASNHIVDIILNGSVVGTAEWEGQTEYISEITMSQRDLRRQNYLGLQCRDTNDTYNKVKNDPRYTGPEWDVYLNWAEMDYWREFISQSSQLEFSTETIPPVTKTVQYSIAGFSRADVEIFQIDRAGAVAKIINPKVMKMEDGSYTAIFEDKVLQPTRYFMKNTTVLTKPNSIVKDQPSTLHDPANRIDYIMITHRNFRESTERLADFRRKQGLDVIVVDVEDIYDEFSYGIFDPKAIKRFLRYAYFNWDKIPTYVLLMGDAHWDYKYVKHEYYVKYETYPRIYVPTYHAQSIPYGEAALDHRFVTVDGDDILPDMFIGRIPAENVEEADNVVDKIIRYESNPYRGQWQSRILLAADDDKSKSGDEVFENSRRELVTSFIPVSYESAEAYLRKIREPYLARNMIITEFNKGVVIAEYSGHGGIHHWAHEGILHVSDLDKLQNYNKYPFVITTTCDNGYFDNPMSKSIMEVFLEQRNRGAIACLSATRLTYGQGNAAFDKILYPRIFDGGSPTLGKIMAEAKIDFINLGMTSWIGSAEQYTLFGDPATRLALPEHNIELKLARTVVDSSKQLELEPGTVKRLKLNPITGAEEPVTDTGFNAEMRISVVYPNNRDESETNDLAVQSQTVNIRKGEFDRVLLPIPNGVIPGEGRLRCYANSGSAAAIGGVRFSVSRPVIEYYTGRIINEESLQIYAAVADNLGNAGIKSVLCRWHNSETWKQQFSDMVPGKAPPDAPEVEGTWYILKENIPLSRPGTYIDYEIHVQDTESSDEVISPLERIRVPVGVNLAISRQGPSLLPDISYSYSPDQGAWLLSTSVENNGGKLVRQPVAVYFFEGNPDRNRDHVIDLAAEILGHAIVEYVDGADSAAAPGQWAPGETVIQACEVSLELDKPLYSGSHRIYAWINPKVSSVQNLPQIERVEDADKMDDKASRLFQINEFAVGRGNEPTQAQSLDGTLAMVIPPGSVDETVMSITRLTPPESEWKQPDLSLAPMPEQGLDGGAFRMQLASGEVSLKEEVPISVRFDATAMWDLAKEARGLAEKQDYELSPTEREWIELASQAEARKLGIFAWQEDIGVWKYVPSELVTSRRSLVENGQADPFLQEPYVTLPMNENRSDVMLSLKDVTVDEIITPLGEWVLFFLSSDRYRMYFRHEGMSTYEKLEYGNVGQTHYDGDVGVGITLNRGSRDFGFGDVFTFDTYQDADGAIRLADLRSHNAGDGAARLGILSPEDFRNVSYVSGEWAIFFISATKFEIHSYSGSLVRNSLGYPVTGEVGRELLVPSIGVRIDIHPGRWPFQFGDKIVFETLSTGIVRAQLRDLKTITLMHSNDLTPPDIQVWINRQLPQDGAVVAPRPEISLLFSDANGIDVDSLSFLVSINDRDFNPVPGDDYEFSERVKSSSFVTNVPIFYSPVLNIGKYRYRVDVLDFNGNRAKSDTGDYLEFMFLIEKKPDIEPPTINITTGGLTLMHGHVFNKSSLEFLVDIRDDHALDEPMISISLAPVEETLEPLEQSEYTMTMSDNLRDAEIVYNPHLMNGEYIMQIQAADTSSNSAYLTPPEAEPLRFRVDEEVAVGEIVNMPNPFSDTTTFFYSLTQPADRVTIKIYTVKGRLVRTLVQDFPRWQYNEEFWDGRDEDGVKLASGVYLYKCVVKDDDRKLERIGKIAIIR
ncbi:C25 family cysteine peptidase [Candidatus Poribacteria bacterium]